MLLISPSRYVKGEGCVIDFLINFLISHFVNNFVWEKIIFLNTSPFVQNQDPSRKQKKDRFMAGRFQEIQIMGCVASSGLSVVQSGIIR